jgi:hypothetical protein
LIDTPACSENLPAWAAPLRPSPSPCAATVCSVNTFCPAHGPTAIRQAPGDLTARNTGALRPSVTYTPSTKIM